MQFHGLGKVREADSKRENAPAPMQRWGFPLKYLRATTPQRQAAERRDAAAARATHNVLIDGAPANVLLEIVDMLLPLSHLRSAR